MNPQPFTTSVGDSSSAPYRGGLISAATVTHASEPTR
jgi:hypothetical protein